MNNGNAIQDVVAGGTSYMTSMVNGKQQIWGANSANITSMLGGNQLIYWGGTGTVDEMNGSDALQKVDSGLGTVGTLSQGKQVISASAVGSVSTMFGGIQSNAGLGYVTTISGGTQSIVGGTGSAVTMYGGKQDVGSNLSGHVDAMSGGVQNVWANATGTINTMSDDGQQIIYGSGHIVTMSKGQQFISAGTGTIDTMFGGTQTVSAGVTGKITTIKGSAEAIQQVYIGATGFITTLNNVSGSQTIEREGIGNIETLQAGIQAVYDGGQGFIKNITGTEEAKQTVSSGGKGTITSMNNISAVQTIEYGGSGEITTLQAGQIIVSGYGYVDNMQGGTQEVFSATNAESGGIGEINVMSAGTQKIKKGAQGSITSMTGISAVSQSIEAGGTGTVTTMDNTSAVQAIASGASGETKNLIKGLQTIVASGRGSIETMSDGGTQNIGSSAFGYVGTMNGGVQNITSKGDGSAGIMNGGTQIVSANAYGYVETMKGGSQTVSGENGLAVVGVMSGGSQIVAAGATGTVTTMSGGSQNVLANGKGSVTTMNEGGIQDIAANGSGYVTTMNAGGSQKIAAGGSGYVTTMNSGGSQNIAAGGTGTIENLLTGATQTVVSGAQGIVKNVSSGASQDIASGGTGTVETMSAGGGSQAVAAGGTGIITNLMSGAQQEVAAGVVGIAVNVASGATQNVVSGGSGTVTAMAGGYQTIAAGGTGTVTALNAGQQVVSAGGTSLNTTLNGGTLAVLDNTAVVENVAMDTGSILFNGAGANYNLTGNFAARGGTVYLTRNADGTSQAPATYETLTVDNLNGNGTNFLMNTDLNSETNGDKLVIQAAAANAGGTIQIYDQSLVDSNPVNPNKRLLLVTDNSGTTSWTGKSLDTGGLWIITPTIEQEGSNWYLVMREPESKLPNEVALTNAGFINAAYGAWRNAVTDDSLRMHLGDLRYNQVQPGIWARIKAGKLGADGYKGSYQMYQVGIDQQYANTAFGFAVDHLVGSNDYETGTGKNSMTNLSLYATNYHPSGFYSDVVVKAGKYNGDMNVNSTNDAADYGTWGYSASYELGKTVTKANGFFVEPAAQFILGRLQGADYTSDKGVSVNSDASTSFLGRVGFVAGRKLPKGGDYYLKANLWREFTGSGDINLSALNNYGKKDTQTQSYSHKDTWFTLGLGGNLKLAPMTHLYGDIEKTFGADIQKKWQVNAGIRWEF